MMTNQFKETSLKVVIFVIHQRNDMHLRCAKREIFRVPITLKSHIISQLSQPLFLMFTSERVKIIATENFRNIK